MIYLLKNKFMKNILNQYLEKGQLELEQDSLKIPKKKKIKMVENNGLVEIVEKTILLEDGRQLLID
jgi:hypothetical protein